MALATYSDLQASVAAFLDRTDLTATIPDFIALAEAQLARDVRHWRMETRSTLAFSGRYTALPSDWVETVRLTMGNASTGHRALALIGRDAMERERARGADTAGVPTHYALTGGEIEVWPTPAEGLTGELVYLSRVPALSASQTTNWLLAQAPDAYLYGALMQSAPYLHEDARVGTWGNLYAAAVASLNQTSNAAAWSGTALRMRAPR